MNEYLLYGIIALIVIVILAFIFLKVMKNKQPKEVSCLLYTSDAADEL